MAAQVFGSILVGLVVSAVLFLPLLVWQYRRYGRFDALRMLWTTAGFIYATAIVAFTVFPLPEFTPGYCAAHATEPLFDPLRFPRELIDLIQTQGAMAVASDWLVWEFTLNMVLFIPFGLIVRRVFEWPRGVVLAAALGTSVLIELTQLTGNWGLAPCPYRFADTTDLVTNTTGAVIGMGLEKITPRLLSTKSHLLARRDRARPVTRGRRLLGMLLDAWYLVLAAVLGGTIASTIYAITQGGPGQALTPAQLLELQQAIFLGAWLAAMVIVVVPALIGTGASLGQRTVYLAPVPKHGSRSRLLVRALVVQGAIPTGLFLGFPTALLSPLLALAAIVSVSITPGGLSGVVSGCGWRDARLPAPGRPDDTQAARGSIGRGATHPGDQS
ncbi:VanZ family protein [Nocardioides rotundus]|uniref:VanZ family protein n=1 Tax=Nocardioides rotundus TaxID=1774216 RepID=UPI001CBBD50C|nr:VanZ family protein [Nocardioides rotundus]UAL30427.1 VanZ family protein [Nocardioides rotundus]